MPRLCTVYDTNVYRGLAASRFAQLLKLERNHSVIGYANYATATEILSQLATPDTPDGRSASAAAGRLVQHCTEYDGSTYSVRFVAPPLEQIARYIFGVEPTGQEEFATGYGRILGGWVTEPEHHLAFATVLSGIAEHSASLRDDYVGTLWRTVVRTIAPDAKTWSDVGESRELRERLLAAIALGTGRGILALGLASQAGGLIGRSVPAADEARVTAHILENFGLIVEYRHRVLEGLVRNGPDMSKRKRANGVFDVHVCGSISGVASLRGVPVVLVTDDRDILDAAAAISYDAEVKAVDGYEALLSSNSAFDEWISGVLRRQDERRHRLATAV